MRWYPDRRWPLLRVAVVGPSMAPVLRGGDWLLALRTRRIRPGQLVVAWDPVRPDFRLVKRAVRREGDGWWLESDFPDAPGARDSRQFGLVPAAKVVGPVIVRYHPDFKIFFRPNARWKL